MKEDEEDNTESVPSILKTTRIERERESKKVYKAI